MRRNPEFSVERRTFLIYHVERDFLIQISFLSLQVCCVTACVATNFISASDRLDFVRNQGVIELWGGRWGSNPRQQESQSWTLPTELRPPLKLLAKYCTKRATHYTRLSYF